MALVITQTDSTQTTVTVWVYGMDINYPRKALDIYINGSFHDDYETNNSGFGLYYTVENLSANTSYSLEIRAFCYKNNDWYPDPDSNQNVATITISTSGGGGGGGGGLPTYRASTSGNSIEIEIINYGSNCETYAYLYNSASSSSQIASQSGNRIVSFSGLSDGTYYVQVDYRDNDITSWTTLQNDSTGQIRTRVDVNGSGPSPTGGGYVYIYTGSQWQKAKPYIYTGSTNGWQPATPYIYTGSAWKKCTD